MTTLVDRATEFAAVLTQVVNGTITTGARFVVTPVAGEPQVWIFPEGSTPTRPRLLPITAGRGPGEPARLWIKATFRASLDDTGIHLAIRTSVFALVIDETTARPAVRLEYDRDFGSEPDDNPAGRPSPQRSTRPDPRCVRGARVRPSSQRSTA